MDLNIACYCDQLYQICHMIIVLILWLPCEKAAPCYSFLAFLPDNFKGTVYQWGFQSRPPYLQFCLPVMLDLTRFPD